LNKILKVIGFLSKFTEDFFILLGLLLLTKGFSMVYKPLGYLVLGVFFIFIGVKAAKVPPKET
jgi:hypothetical protein